MRPILFLLAASIAMLPSTTHAEWQPGGTRVIDLGIGPRTWPAVTVPDGTGGVFIGLGPSFQHVTASGEVYARPLPGSSFLSIVMAVSADDAQGVFVARYRDSQIVVYHRDHAGATSGDWPDSGAVATRVYPPDWGGGWPPPIALIPSLDGQVFVAWQDSVQKLDCRGERLWETNRWLGARSDPADPWDYVHTMRLYPDARGGIMEFGRIPIDGDGLGVVFTSQVTCRHWSASARLFRGPLGSLLGPVQDGWTTALDVAQDRSGDAVAVWAQGDVNNVMQRVYSARVTEGGGTPWQEPVLLCDNSQLPWTNMELITSPVHVIRTVIGHTLAAWQNTAEVRIQSIAPDGRIEWVDGGVALPSLPLTGFAMAADDAGGAYLGVPSHGAYPYSTGLRVYRVSADGRMAPGWPPAGYLIANELYDVQGAVPNLRLSAGISGCAVLTWQASGDDAMAMLITPDGPAAALPSTAARQLITTPTASAAQPATLAILALCEIHPNPAQGTLAVRFSLADETPARLAVFDIAGRCVWQHDVVARAGEQLEQVTFGTRQAAGVYFVRLAQGARSVSRSVVWAP